MLQLKREGGEGDLLRDRQDSDSRQIRDWISSVPLTGGRVEDQATTCGTDLSVTGDFRQTRRYKTKACTLFIPILTVCTV